jgi:hypothetical protein
MREAMSEATIHCAPAHRMTGSLPNRSYAHPPKNTPASRATVPPTVEIELAISRSAVGTSRGTTATAVAR